MLLFPSIVIAVKKFLGNPWSSNLFLAGFALILLLAYVLSDEDDSAYFAAHALTWIILIVAYMVIFTIWKTIHRRRWRRPPTTPVDRRRERRRRPNLLRTPWLPAFFFLAFLFAGFIPDQDTTGGGIPEFLVAFGLFALYLLGYLVWTFKVTLHKDRRSSRPPNTA